MAPDRNRRWTTVPSGLVLIAVGIMMVLNALRVFHYHISKPWYLGLAAFGLLLLVSVGGKAQKRAVFPGTLFLLTGLFLFLWENQIIPQGDGTTWPAFLIIVGIAFIALYFSDQRKGSTLMLGLILSILGAMFMVETYYYLPWSPQELIIKSWPLIVVFVGISAFLRGWRRWKVETEEAKPDEQIPPPEEEPPA